jgi:hypothetical protein
MEGLGVELSGEGDNFLLGQRRNGSELDDLAFGEVFEIEDLEPSCPCGRRRTVTEGGWASR